MDDTNNGADRISILTDSLIIANLLQGKKTTHRISKDILDELGTHLEKLMALCWKPGNDTGNLINWISRKSNTESHNIAQCCAVRKTDWRDENEDEFQNNFRKHIGHRRVMVFTDAARDQEGNTSIGMVFLLLHLFPSRCSSFRIGYTDNLTQSAEEAEAVAIIHALKLLETWGNNNNNTTG